ncbi:hypothetical protein WJX77_009021 [Trebouxia sp. C0004]
MIVHCYPFYPLLESVFDALAAACLEPTVQDILATACMIPMTEETELLDDYIVYITDWYHHEYVPVPRFCVKLKACFPRILQVCCELIWGCTDLTANRQAVHEAFERLIQSAFWFAGLQFKTGSHTSFACGRHKWESCSCKKNGGFGGSRSAPGCSGCIQPGHGRQTALFYSLLANGAPQQSCSKNHPKWSNLLLPKTVISGLASPLVTWTLSISP